MGSSVTAASGVVVHAPPEQRVPFTLLSRVWSGQHREHGDLRYRSRSQTCRLP